MRLQSASVLLLLAIGAHAISQTIKFNYTGQLMGYYRQDISDADQPNSVTGQLRKELEESRKQGFGLTLGMGDNFAPEYGAALAWRGNNDCVVPPPTNLKGKGVPFPRYFYKTDLAVTQKAECDNVTAYLMKAGYRAIVPGKEDFIYGSGWLSHLARMLAMESQSGTDKHFENGEMKLHMLAANLRLQITGKDGRVWQQCPLLFSESATWSDASQCDAAASLNSGESLKDVAYTTSSLGGTKTLIVGVVAQNLLDAVSNENRTFCATTVGDLGIASYSVVDCAAKEKTIQGRAFVSDPLRAVIQAIEQARTTGCYQDYVVMAQMSRGEAEELAARLQAKRNADNDFPAISLVLSAASVDQSSGNYTLTNSIANESNIGLTPVLTPHPAYDARSLNHQSHPMLRPLSRVALSNDGISYRLESTTNRDPYDIEASHSTLDVLLQELLKKNNVRPVSHTNALSELLLLGCFEHQGKSGDEEQQHIEDCNVWAMQYLLAAMRDSKGRNADVAFLERRDFFFGNLPDGYLKIPDEICKDHAGRTMVGDEERMCRLQVALDLVLWKGDYIEWVMATGADISAMIAASQTQSALTQALQQPATSGSWLQTFGLVKTSQAADKPGSPPKLSSSSFEIPGDPSCLKLPDTTGVSPNKDTYCILSNSIEQPPQKDGGFWIVTSDHLADDTTVYPVLSKLAATYRPEENVRKKTERTYLSEAIAGSLIVPSSGVSAATAVSPVAASPTLAKVDPPVTKESTAKRPEDNEIALQRRVHFQMDAGKIFFGYLTSSAGENGDNYVAQNFQGVSDSRASAVSQYELDAEAQLRGLWTFGEPWPGKHHTVRFSSGFQTDVEYDRSAQGNLNNAADNASYGANNWAIGPLFQFGYPLGPASKLSNYGLMKAAQWSFVISPQVQRQVRGTNLYFSYSPLSPKIGNDELTVGVDYSRAWNLKEGFRFDAADSPHPYQLRPGSYVELGFQQSEQYHVLSDLTLLNPGTGLTKACLANSSTPISSCVASASKGTTPSFPIDSFTQISNLTYANEPAEGLYWDISMKWRLKKSGTFGEADLSANSKGDAFVRRSARNVLSTQTLYDVPLNVGVTFQVLPNLSFAPMGNFFFYSNQLAEQRLLIRGFNISMRWYYDRDSGVPFHRQLFLLGPASQDQTKLTKMKTTQ